MIFSFLVCTRDHCSCSIQITPSLIYVPLNKDWIVAGLRLPLYLPTDYELEKLQITNNWAESWRNPIVNKEPKLGLYLQHPMYFGTSFPSSCSSSRNSKKARALTSVPCRNYRPFFHSWTHRGWIGFEIASTQASPIETMKTFNWIEPYFQLMLLLPTSVDP